MIKSKAILRLPFFLAVGSIIFSMLYLADRDFPIVASSIGKGLDFVGGAAFFMSLAGAVSGLGLLQINPKERIIQWGTLLSGIGLILSTFGLPL